MCQTRKIMDSDFQTGSGAPGAPLPRTTAPLPHATGNDDDGTAAKEPLTREIWVLIAAAFVIAVGYGLVAPVLPQFAHSFDVSVSAAAVVISAFAFTRLVFAPMSGAFVEKFGERWVYIAGILIVALSSAACAFAQDYWQLLIYRGLGGIGSTMFTVAAMGLLVRLAPPTGRGRVTSAYAGSFLLGGIAGPAIGGLLAGFGLQLPFLVYAAALVLAAVVVATQLHPKLKLQSDAPVPLEPAKAPMPFREALGYNSYRASLVSAFANGWSAFGIRMALVPLFATVALHGGPGLAGLALAVFAIGTGVALTFSGKLADSWGRKPMVIAGLVVNTAAMAVLGLTTTIPLFLVVSAIAGIGSGLFGPAQQASVADVIGNKRSGGKVLAAFQMSQDFGTILGPIIAGAVIDAISYGPAFAMAAVTGAIAIGFWLAAGETARLPQGQRHSI